MIPEDELRDDFDAADSSRWPVWHDSEDAALRISADPAYVYTWTDGSWVAIGEAIPPDLAGQSVVGQDGDTLTVTFVFDASTPPDLDVLGRIDDTLEDWERRGDAARWYPGLDEGASAVEYGLLIAAVAAALVAVVFALGPVVSRAFDRTCSDIGDGLEHTQTATCPGR